MNSAGPVSESDVVLEVRGLSVAFGRTERSATTVVDDVDLLVRRQRTVALVGESGSGKTSVAKAVMGLIRPPVGFVTGDVLLNGRNIARTGEGALSRVRGKEVGMIFQEPMRSLNPAFTVGDQISEVIRRHEGLKRSDAHRRAVELLELVHIPGADRAAKRYPFELSGGMCQRVMIASAVACRPSLLIADEPTTALDVTVQAQVLDLLKELQDELGVAILFITHDLGVVADVADDVMVMYAGQIVEHASAEALFDTPRHPYTAGLLGAIPDVSSAKKELGFIVGQVPKPSEWGGGCRFAGRCPHAVEACSAPVALRPAGLGQARCARLEELALTGASHA